MNRKKIGNLGAMFSLALPLSVSAALPEPSFLLRGDLLRQGVPTNDPGRTISIQNNGNEIATFQTTSSTGGSYGIEIPLEASQGSRNIGRARVNDVVSVLLDGSSVGSIQITERGALGIFNIDLPDDALPGLESALESSSIASTNSNSRNAGSRINFGELDIDSDGVSNQEEYLLGQYDPFGDFDADGFSNEDEYTQQSNPADKESFPPHSVNLGTFDVLTLDRTSPSKLMNSNSLSMTFEKLSQGESSINSISFTHWNLDGVADLVVATNSGEIQVYHGRSDERTFDEPENITFANIDTDVVKKIGFNDFDADGILEAWTYDKSASEILVYKREANEQPYGVSAPWVEVNLDDEDDLVSLVDLDLDGIADVIAVRDDGTTREAIFYNGVIENNLWNNSDSIELGSQTHYAYLPLANLDSSEDPAKGDLMVLKGDMSFQISLSSSQYENTHPAPIYDVTSSDPILIARAVLPGSLSSAMPVFTGDLNGDGYTDLVLRSNGDQEELQVLYGAPCVGLGLDSCQ